MTVIYFPLIDGSLVPLRHRHQELAQRMADDLVRLDAFQQERTAIRVLFESRQYKMLDIMALIDDARQIAMQDAVAREMSDV